MSPSCKDYIYLFWRGRIGYVRAALPLFDFPRSGVIISSPSPYQGEGDTGDGVGKNLLIMTHRSAFDAGYMTVALCQPLFYQSQAIGHWGSITHCKLFARLENC